MNDQRSTPKPIPTTMAPLQFGLKHMLVAVLALCVWLAFVTSMGSAGAFLGAFVLVTVGSIVLAVIGIRRRNGVYFALGVFGTSVGLAVGFLLPIVPAKRPISLRQADCENNLKHIGLALLNYHERYGSFPPAYIADENGKPKHSWRVLILPFMENQRLYEQYDFSEPWNGPNNRQLVGMMPKSYFCWSSSAGQNNGQTNYLAVIGPGAAWPGENNRTLSEFTDGAAQTIMVVEVANSKTNWMEPSDLHIDPFSSTPAANRKPGTAGSHPGGNNVVFADGSTGCLPNDLDPQVLHAMLTVDGGETIDWYSSDRPRLKEQR
jgi:prepilin-type processing-associated H-X9-DG protein